jgi:hypothetical protein
LGIDGHVVCAAVLGEPTKNPVIDGIPLRNDSTRDAYTNWGWPMREMIDRLLLRAFKCERFAREPWGDNDIWGNATAKFVTALQGGAA